MDRTRYRFYVSEGLGLTGLPEGFAGLRADFVRVEGAVQEGPVRADVGVLSFGEAERLESEARAEGAPFAYVVLWEHAEAESLVGWLRSQPSRWSGNHPCVGGVEEAPTPPRPLFLPAPSEGFGASQLGALLERAVAEHRAWREAWTRIQFARLLVDESADGMAVVDETAVFRHVNPATERLTGLAAEDIIGRSVERAPFLPPAERARALAELERVRRESHGLPFETLLQHRNGELRPVEITARRLYLQGRLHIHLMVRDITRRREVEGALRDSEERLQRLVDASSEGILIFEGERILDVNLRGAELLGRRAGELTGASLRDVLSGSATNELERQEGSAEDTRRFQIELAHARGGPCTFAVETRPFPMAGRAVRVATFRDVTEEQRNAEQVRLARLVLEKTPSVVMRWAARPGSPILYVSDRIEEYGYSAEELMREQTSFESLIHPEDLPTAKEHATGHREKGDQDYQLTYRLLTRSGEERWMQDLTVIEQDPSGAGGDRIGILLDVTARRRAEEAARHMVYFDSVTGLPNRTLLRERLHAGQAAKGAAPEAMALFLVDIDRFKVINSSLGLEKGDLLLRAIGERLQAVATGDDLLARVGGDEFVLVIPRVETEAHAESFAEQIAQCFQRPFRIDDKEVFIGASIGICLSPRHGSDAETLLRNAESAMFRAKDDGRNTFAFYARDMTDSSMDQLDLEAKLRRAVERKELFLHYQPQFDCVGGGVVGAEALVRWQHPAHGVLNPASFIPLAEETGLIHEIGSWVLRTACTQMKAWHDIGLDGLRVAVNISPRQFLRASLVNEVERVLTETGLPGDMLELELTESVLMRDVDRGSRVLRELKEMGVKISIDDFGTGYSSLTYLKQFPIDNLKIDQGFVRDITVDQDDAAIATAVIMLSRSLNIGVVAEGVETEEQRAFLQSRECHVMQGFLLSRPLAPRDFRAFLEKLKLEG